ncbi:hypothetical protein QP179_15655 [Sphingomonas aurantiaca]|uniref:hypothetical protein n=1 Tax=Sphingomonas aurantiaca TaxID=185949 RepID=UPI002FE220D9
MQIDAIKNACSDPRWRPGSAAWASICASSAIPDPGASLALHLAGGEGLQIGRLSERGGSALSA